MTALATRHGDMWVRTFGAGPIRVVALHGFTLHGGMYEHLAALVHWGWSAGIQGQR